MFGDGFGVLVRHFDDAEEQVREAAAEFAQGVVTGRRLVVVGVGEGGEKETGGEQDAEEFGFHGVNYSGRMC